MSLIIYAVWTKVNLLNSYRTSQNNTRMKHTSKRPKMKSRYTNKNTYEGFRILIARPRERPQEGTTQRPIWLPKKIRNSKTVFHRHWGRAATASIPIQRITSNQFEISIRNLPSYQLINSAKTLHFRTRFPAALSTETPWALSNIKQSP